MNKQYQYKFGTLTVTGKMYSNTIRIDQWKRNHGDFAEFPEHTHVTGPKDDSPRVTTYDTMTHNPEAYRRYDSKCSYCYLGYPHSVDAHDRSLSEN